MSEQTVRRPLGYQVTLTYCRACAPEGVRDFVAPMREGDDHGFALQCDTCGEDLLPCEHQWNEWRPAFGGGEIRFCTANDCGESEHR